MFKIIKRLILITTLFILSNSVYAQTCNVNDTNGFCLRQGSESIEKAQFFGKELDEVDKPGETFIKISTNNDVLYCSDGMRTLADLPGTGAIFDYACKEKTINKNSLIFSYEYGYKEYSKSGYTYNSNYLSGNYAEDYYITQSAIWYFSPPTEEYFLNYWNNGWIKNYDFKNKTYAGIKNETVTRITTLINDATNASNATASLELSVADKKFTSEGDYYVSNAIKITGKYLSKAITLNISGVEGAFITTDKNSTTRIEKIEISNLPFIEKTIYLKIPKANIDDIQTNIKLQVSSETTFNDSTKVIECYPRQVEENDRLQQLAKYVPSYTTIKDELTFSLKKYPVKILKVDTNNNYINGATLVIKKDNQVISTWTSDNESKELFLEPGIYTLEETKTPKGYIINKNIITFTVDNEGKIYIDNNKLDKITIVNKPIKIYISKKEIKKDKELIGATLRITDKDGQIAKDITGTPLEWTTDGNIKEFHIAPGTYILEEIKAPEGYELSDKKIEFTISEDGVITSEKGLLIKQTKIYDNNLITFENIPEPKKLPTGSIMLYASLTMALIALGITTFIIIKRTKK